MIDNAGGGLNISAKGSGSKTAICTDVGAGQTGAIGVDPNLAEITAHELLGHGYGGNHGTAGHGHVDALHMSNLVRQKMKRKKF